MINVTLIIAIIGAITGILGLIIQFIEYKKSNVRLKMIIDEKKSFYVPNIDKYYQCDYSGVVTMKISNCSSLPITIDEAMITCDNRILMYLNCEKKIKNEYKLDEDKSIIIKVYKQPILPLRIECYDTIFLSFIFPFFDEIKEKKFEFILKTPRKDYKKNIIIKDFNLIF